MGIGWITDMSLCDKQPYSEFKDLRSGSLLINSSVSQLVSLWCSRAKLLSDYYKWNRVAVWAYLGTS